jgi:hypothetical protein
MKSLVRLLVALALVCVPALATTHYIAASGSDSANGTSTSTPWLHAPGMPGATGNAASYSPAAGDVFYFRGGDTWHFSNSSPASGVYTGGAWSGFNSGNTSTCVQDPSGTVVTTGCIYYGTLSSFFNSTVCGASFCRPIFSADNPQTTAQVSSCTYNNGTTNLITVGSASAVWFDNIEFTGWCYGSTVSSNVLVMYGLQDRISNSYFHAWSTTTSVDDSMHMIDGNLSLTNYMRCDHNVFDGSDSSLGTSTNYTGNGTAATGFVFYNTCSEIDHNYINRVSNVMIANPKMVHDNWVQYSFQAGNGSHGNLFEWNNNNWAGCTYLYNNVFQTTIQGNGNDLELNNSCGYEFNNISWKYRVLSSGSNGTDGANCYNFDSTNTSSTVQRFNNTTDYPCTLISGNDHPALTTSNEHLIGYNATTCTGACSASGYWGSASLYSGSGTLTNNGGHVFQSESTANGQGYVTGNAYAPTSGSSATVGAGINNTSICTGMDNAEATAACELSTTAGVTEVSGEGGLVVGGSTVTPNARPSSGAWNTGAYQYSTPQATTPTASPSTGTYTSVQSVTLTASTGSVICWNTTGSPATNGATGCGNGTLYTGAISVSASETLYFVAGGTGYTDSSVGSAAYIINLFTVWGTGSGTGYTVVGWQQSPLPIGTNFFGVHYNQQTTSYPDANFQIGFPVIRLWDTNTGWADMQTTSSCNNSVTTGCNFAALDAWINKFGANQQIILTLAKTPNFIASNVSDSNCGYTSTLGSPNGSCTPPTDLACDGSGTDATWIGFVEALWNHLNSTNITSTSTPEASVIYGLEIWNGFDANAYWDNTYISSTRCSSTTDAVQKMLIRMEQDAQYVTQGKNPNGNSTYPSSSLHSATLIFSPPSNGPASGSPFVAGGTEYKLLADGAGSYADVISVHGYLPTGTCGAPSSYTGCAVPEQMDSALTQLKSAMSSYSLSSKPIAITEFNWGATSSTTDTQFIQAFVGRYFTLASQQGVLDANWYNLATGSSCSSGPVLESSGKLCPTGLAFNVVQDWLQGATFYQQYYIKTARNDCASGSNIYEFPMTAWSGMSERIVFYDGLADSSSCSYSIPSGYTWYQDMAGINHPLRNVSTILLDNRPVILQQAGPPNYFGAMRRPGHELDVLQLNIPYGQTPATYTGTCVTQSNAAGCLPQLGGQLGAGMAVQDMATGALEVRLTDTQTDPNMPTTQNYVNLQGNSEQMNPWSIDENYLCMGKGGSNNVIMQLNPPYPLYYTPSGQTWSTPLLWPGNASGIGAWQFNWCTASRVTPGMFYDVTTTMTPGPVYYATSGTLSLPGIIYTVTIPADTNAHIAGNHIVGNSSSGLPTSVTVVANIQQACLNNAHFNSTIPFFPLNITNGDLGLNDTVLSFAIAMVHRGCYDAPHAVIDWQPNTAYSSTSNTCGNVTTCGKSIATTAAFITPMDNNPGGWIFYASTGGTSGSTAPATWCQSAGCQVSGDGSNGLVWTAYTKQQANWSSQTSGTGYQVNNCAGQGYDTIELNYHVHDGDQVTDFEHTGDCDVYATGEGYVYHDNVQLSAPVDQSTGGWGLAANNPDLFTNHAGSSSHCGIDSTAASTCIGTLLGGYGASCSSSFMNNQITWKYDGTTLHTGGVDAQGHNAWGCNQAVGTTTMPAMSEESVWGTTFERTWTPFTYKNVYGGNLPGSHVTWNNTADGNGSDQAPFLASPYNPQAGFNGYTQPFQDPGLVGYDLYYFNYAYTVQVCHAFSAEQGAFGQRYHVFNFSPTGRFVSYEGDGYNQYGPFGSGCAPDWQPNYAYALNTYVQPMVNNAVFNDDLNSCVFQVTTAGTSAATAPNFQSISGYSASPQTCTGSVTDLGGVTYTAVPGGNSCRQEMHACAVR